MSIVQRIVRGIAAAACIVIVAGGASAQNPQPPIRIGSTLALTGPLAATSLVHKVVGEIYVEQLNKRGGLLGRQVAEDGPDRLRCGVDVDACLEMQGHLVLLASLANGLSQIRLIPLACQAPRDILNFA